MRSTLLEACPQLGWPTAQSPFKQKSQKERVSGSRAEIRRRSPLGSIGWPNRSRSNLGMTNLNSSFSLRCFTRGKSLFREQEKMQLLKRLRQSVGPDVPWAGFYTIGEIGPVEEHNLRHLYTSVVLALS